MRMRAFVACVEAARSTVNTGVRSIIVLVFAGRAVLAVLLERRLALAWVVSSHGALYALVATFVRLILTYWTGHASVRALACSKLTNWACRAFGDVTTWVSMERALAALCVAQPCA